MLRRPTALIVGAGASFEAGLPLGSELLANLARSLQLKFDHYSLKSGDSRIENALRKYCRTAGDGGDVTNINLMNEYVKAGWRIAEAAREGMSIDAIIDQHEDERDAAPSRFRKFGPI